MWCLCFNIRWRACTHVSWCRDVASLCFTSNSAAKCVARPCILYLYYRGKYSSIKDRQGSICSKFTSIKHNHLSCFINIPLSFNALFTPFIQQFVAFLRRNIVCQMWFGQTTPYPPEWWIVSGAFRVLPHAGLHPGSCWLYCVCSVNVELLDYLCMSCLPIIIIIITIIIIIIIIITIIVIIIIIIIIIIFINIILIIIITIIIRTSVTTSKKNNKQILQRPLSPRTETYTLGKFMLRRRLCWCVGMYVYSDKNMMAPNSDCFVLATAPPRPLIIDCIYFLSQLFITLKSIITYFTYITRMQIIVQRKY